MRVSMERLLEGAVDYAGTFPPGSLPPSKAVERFIRGLGGDERWILNRYACSTENLAELADEIDKRPDAPYFPVTAIGRRAENRREWEDALAADAEAMNAFHRMVDDRAEVESYEVRLPAEGNSEACINDLVGFRDADLFVEIALEDGFEDVLAGLAETEWLGAKVRCGGEGGAPDAYKLAGFLRSCIDLELPFKLTAGLHRPVSQLTPRSYGFLSILGAAAIGLAEDLSRREIEQVIRDPNPGAWSFDDHGLSWHDRSADLTAIEDSRNLFASFGSCSIDEPLEGLRDFS